MNGQVFFTKIKTIYTRSHTHLYGNYYFEKWLPKKNGKQNYQFEFMGNRKSIPQDWLIQAKNDMNLGVIVDREWFNINFKCCNNDDCRASVAIYLLSNH
jgi:hypothetical protein